MPPARYALYLIWTFSALAALISARDILAPPGEPLPVSAPSRCCSLIETENTNPIETDDDL